MKLDCFRNTVAVPTTTAQTHRFKGKSHVSTARILATSRGSEIYLQGHLHWDDYRDLMARNLIVLGSLLLTMDSFPASDQGQARAGLVADFDGGGSSNSPVTGVVDAYPGMAGDGWTSAWSLTGSAGMKSAAVVNTTPLNDGGNYLTLTTSGNSSQDGFVNRSYGSPIDLTKPLRVEFDYRMDNVGTFSSAQDVVQLWDNDSGISWYLLAYGDRSNWQVYDGDQADGGFTFARVLDTGLAFAKSGGTTYSFEVDVDPTTRTWDVTISDGANSVTMNDLGFRTSQYSARGLLQLGGRLSDTGETRVHAFDSITISQVPEPASAILLVIGGVFLTLGTLRQNGF